MIQSMDFIGEGDAGGNKVINGHHNLRPAHVLVYFFVFINK